MIDPLSGVVSMVDTVLTRLDAQKAADEESLRERVDVRDALLDLLRLLRLWTAAADETTSLLAEWVERRKYDPSAQPRYLVRQPQRSP